MTDNERDGYIIGCYRRLGELIDLLKAGGRADAEAKPKPREQMLPGFAEDDTRNDAPDGCVWTMPPAGEIAKSVLGRPKPREWCNAVRVYEAIWKHFGVKYKAFNLSDLCRDDRFLSSVSVATKNRISPASLSKLLSVMRRSMAIYLDEKGYYRCNEPTDELREAVERLSKKRAAAKEVTNA